MLLNSKGQSGSSASFDMVKAVFVYSYWNWKHTDPGKAPSEYLVSNREGVLDECHAMFILGLCLSPSILSLLRRLIFGLFLFNLYAL